jgi:predicted transcriptional regulator
VADRSHDKIESQGTYTVVQVASILDRVINLIGKILQKLRRLGITKNEFIGIKGIRYPVHEILGYSEEKLADILLRQSAATPEEYAQALTFVEGLRNSQIKHQ